MAKYIELSRITDALIDNTSLEGRDLEEAVNAICAIPAADVRPVRYGKWVKRNGAIFCSECNYDTPFIVRNFCPNCGANMRGGEPHE